MRLTALMFSTHIADAAVPMSLLAEQPEVVFNDLRPAIDSVAVEMYGV